MNTNTARRMPWDVMGGNLEVPQDMRRDLAATLAFRDLNTTTRMAPIVAAERAEGEALAFAQFTDAPKHRAIIRPLRGVDTVVGVVGGRYTPIQNVDAFAVAQTILDANPAAQIAGAADYRNGGASVLALDLGTPVTLRRRDGGTDTTVVNLLVKNAHDGSGALTFALTPVRLACTNALQASIKGAERVWKMAHTPNAEARMDLAHQAIVDALDYRDAFQEKAQALLDTDMTDAAFAKIVAGLFPVAHDAEGKVADRKRETQADLLALFRTSPTLEGCHGTAWGAYQALTEYADHYAPVRSGEVGRAENALEGATVRFKMRVAERFMSAV